MTRGPITQYFNKCHKEIVHTLSQLLDLRMLICASFVSIDCDPLIHLYVIEIKFFAKRLHNQLL
nr:hypothetical protein Iba_scaffold18886CG0010 [Ipomoea batatas]